MKLALADHLQLPLEAVTQKFAIVAESGAGKTYTAGVLAEAMLGAGAQVIILEPVGVWWGLQANADGKRAGFSILVMGGDHANLPLTPESGELVGRMLAERGVSAVLDLSAFTTAETKRFVRDFAEAFFQAKKQHKSPVHLVFEEAQTFLPQNPEKDEGVMLNRLERLLKIGRNYGVGWTLVTQQPQSVHKRVLNLAGTLIALRTSGPHERKALALWAASNLDPKEVDLVGDLPGLATGEAHVWSPSFLKVSKRVRINKKTTFDASATPEVGQEFREPKLLAPVELEQLREAMKSVVDQVEGEDPKALRKKVAELERQLAAKPPVQEKPVEVPVSIKLELEQLEEAKKSLQHLFEQVAQRQQVVVTALGNADVLLKPTRAKLPELLPGAVVYREPPRENYGISKFRNPAPAVPGVDGLDLGARKMLAELVAHHPGSLTNRELATRTVMAHGGSSFRTYKSQLTSRGLVERSEGGDLVATSAGLQAAKGARPIGRGELVALWGQKLDRGARAMLDQLLSQTAPLPKNDLATLAGVTPGGSSHRTYMSQLTSAGLAEKVGGGYVVGHALSMGEA